MKINFREMYAYDVKPFIKTKHPFKKIDGAYKEDTSKTLKFIEWSKILCLLYELGAESVRYGNIFTDEGHPSFVNKAGTAPFVRVWVTIDNDRFEIAHPVLNGYEKGYADNQLHIHNATQRAFVKCIAINTGLGLSLWEQDEEETVETPDAVSKESNLKLNQKIFSLFNTLTKLCDNDANKAHTALGTNQSQLKQIWDGDNVLLKEEIVEKLTIKIQEIAEKNG